MPPRLPSRAPHLPESAPAASAQTQPKPKPPPALTSLVYVLTRLLLSTALSVALVAIAVGAMFATTAPELVSLLVEPLSLLLTPGLFVVVLLAHGHDFLPAHVLYASFVFYFAVFYKALVRRPSAKIRHTPVSPPML